MKYFLFNTDSKDKATSVLLPNPETKQEELVTIKGKHGCEVTHCFNFEYNKALANHENLKLLNETDFNIAISTAQLEEFEKSLENSDLTDEEKQKLIDENTYTLTDEEISNIDMDSLGIDEEKMKEVQAKTEKSTKKTNKK